jgi:hypothetical protein
VFPVRYELDSYMLFRGNCVVKGLITFIPIEDSYLWLLELFWIE